MGASTQTRGQNARCGIDPPRGLQHARLNRYAGRGIYHGGLQTGPRTVPDESDASSNPAIHPHHTGLPASSACVLAEAKSGASGAAN